MRSLVISFFLYACESWTLTAEFQRIQAMETTCYCKILCISYKDHVISEAVHAKTQQAVRPHKDLLTIIRRCKLQWYGYVSQSSGLAKTILLGTVKGRRRVFSLVSWCFKPSQPQGEDKADSGRGVKTTSGNGQAWSSPSPRGQWRTMIMMMMMM